MQALCQVKPVIKGGWNVGCMKMILIWGDVCVCSFLIKYFDLICECSCVAVHAVLTLAGSECAWSEDSRSVDLLSKCAYDYSISVICNGGGCTIFPANTCCPSLRWHTETRVLLVVFSLSIFHIHMEMGGREGTESHIKLIWSWIAASVWTDPELA